MQKVVRFLILIMAVIFVLSFSKPNKEKIHWISIKELNEQYSKNPKPILVDIYTDWCGWCKEMDRTTYRNDKLATYINSHYYAVKLDAESKDSMTFNNQRFGYNPGTKSNELAVHLLFGRMEFPTTVFLSTIDARPAPLPGYMKPKEMEAPLKYFGEGTHATKTFVEFNQQFKGEW